MFKYEKDPIFTVDEVTNKIREAIYASGELQNVSVKGELLDSRDTPAAILTSRSLGTRQGSHVFCSDRTHLP